MITPSTVVYQLKDEFGLDNITFSDLYPEVQEEILKNQEIIERLRSYLERDPHDQDTHELMLYEKWTHRRIKKDILCEQI